MGSCISTLDTIFYDVQDEYDVSGVSPRASAATVHASSTKGFMFEQTCYFSMPKGEDVINTRSIIFEPGVRKFLVKCSVHSGYANSSGFYSRLFEVDLRDSRKYEVRTDGSRFDATTHCLIVVDTSTDGEVGRSCDEPYLKEDQSFCEALDLDWLC